MLRRYEGCGAIIWENFRENFLINFFPIIYQEDSVNEFMTLVQGSMIIEEYERKFSELLRFAPFTVLNEREKCRCFDWGLREDIRTIVIEIECTDFGTLIRVTTRIERSHRKA